MRGIGTYTTATVSAHISIVEEGWFLNMVALVRSLNPMDLKPQ